MSEEKVSLTGRTVSNRPSFFPHRFIGQEFRVGRGRKSKGQLYEPRKYLSLVYRWQNGFNFEGKTSQFEIVVKLLLSR